ncbi:hypothetical protein JCM11491_003791 [Sporobolomyces phaffii]
MEPISPGSRDSLSPSPASIPDEDDDDDSPIDLHHPVLRRLVDFLRSQPGGSASRQMLAARLWGGGGGGDGGRSLRRYVQKAFKLGMVEKCSFVKEPWIRLAAAWQISDSLSSPPRSPPSVPIPTKFFPLLAGFAEMKSTTAELDTLFAAVERFESFVVFVGSERSRALNARSWSTLLGEAEDFGIVRVTTEGRWDELYTKVTLLGPEPAGTGGAPPTFAEAAQGQGPRQARSVKVGVLLAGDADYFTRAYTSKGRSGGSCAAMELKNRVERFIRKEKNVPNAVAIDIDALSFLNMKGLSNFLGDDMVSFAQGFNTSPYAFSMSDVGDIPQGADTALKSHLPSLLSRSDFVLFGGSHDNGYADILGGLPRGPIRDKLILLRTTPYCARSILMLGLEEAHFPLLFEAFVASTPRLLARHEPPVGGHSAISDSASSEDDSDSDEARVDMIPAVNRSKSTMLKLNQQEGSTFHYRNLMSGTPRKPFNKLCGLLRKMPGGSATFSDISNRLSQQGSRSWSKGKGAFSKFMQDAVQAKVVTTYYDDDDTRYRVTSTYVPARFRPLVVEIMDHDEFGPLCSLVADALLSRPSPPFPRYKGWKQYLAVAVKLGLVQTGSNGPGQEWVELVEGLLL